MKEYKFENATVRIHEGKYTAEERRAVLEQAAQDFYKAILRSGVKRDQGNRKPEAANA